MTPEEIADESLRVGTVGLQDDPSKIFVRINTTDYINGPVPLNRSVVGGLFPDARGVLLLEMIWVPEKLRNQGVATRVIRRLYHHASSMGLVFSAGAVADRTGAIDRILNSLP